MDGWAWSPRKGIVALRNPSYHRQSSALDAASAFELPPASPQRFHVRNVWIPENPVKELIAGQPLTLELKPFEVLTLEAEPMQ